MSDMYNIYEAKTNLSKLLELSTKGKKIVIAKAGKPGWEIIPIVEKKPKRIPGKLKGKIWYTENCFAPMNDDELKDWYGEDLPPLKGEQK